MLPHSKKGPKIILVIALPKKIQAQQLNTIHIKLIILTKKKFSNIKIKFSSALKMKKKKTLSLYNL